MNSYNSNLPSARLPRLRRELIELHDEPLKGINVIFPHEDDMTIMCLILTPLQGPFHGIRLHLTVNVPENYPQVAPIVSIQTTVKHPNVFMGGYICADVLQEKYRSSRYYNGGYTPGYLLKYIFLQLLSFFSDKNIEQEGGYVLDFMDLYNLEPNKFKSDMKDLVKKFKCNKCGYNDIGTKHYINITPDSNEIEKFDIYGTPYNSQNNNFNDDRKENQIIKTSIKKDVVDLNDDCWLNIIEFLNERDILVLSTAYPRINALIHHYNILLRRQLICFYLRKTFTEAILGIGVKVGSNQSVEKRELIISEFDLFSYEAYRDHRLRSGIWGDSFTHFLPLVLSAVHFEKALPIIKTSLMNIRDYTEWKSELVLKTIPGLMSSMVVNLMKACDNNRQQSSAVIKASEKALQGYCLLLHLLTMLSNQTDQRRRFRHKTNTPNLGEFIIYLFLCRDINWKEFCTGFLEELLSRNVVWFLNKEASLAYIEPDDYISNYRLTKTFELSSTSLRLVMFQVAFLKMTQDMKNSQKNNLDKRYGYPTDEMSNSLLQLIKKIYQVNTWDVFFEMIDYDLFENEKNKIGWELKVLKLLKNAINDSLISGYHQMPYTLNEVYYLISRCEPGIPPSTSSLQRDNNNEEVITGLTFYPDQRSTRQNEDRRNNPNDYNT
ncbi:97_t:CDS:2, partial [Diversispora eburnea]